MQGGQLVGHLLGLLARPAASLLCPAPGHVDGFPQVPPGLPEARVQQRVLGVLTAEASFPVLELDW